jgi:TonB family protein
MTPRLVLTTVLAAAAWTVPAAAQQPPPRDPISPAQLHRVAVEYHDRARKDTSLTFEQRLQAIKTAISYEDRALARDPEYVDALIYKSILLRMQAASITDAEEQARLIQEAQELRGRAVALRPALARPLQTGNAPPASPEFESAVARLNPLRVGGNVKTPTKVRDVKPVFPPDAKAAGVQGVVILEALIADDGAMADARVVRSVAGLDEAALGAVRQWRFTPTLLNGAPTAVLMTVTVNFTLQ